MGPTEFLALVFLYNAAVAGGQYAAPAFLQWVGRVIGQLRNGGSAAAHQAGSLPRSAADVNDIDALAQYVGQHPDLNARERDAVELRQRVESSLANRFSPDSMRGPLRIRALLAGYVATPSNDPAVVANDLYGLALREDKVHWLVDAMLSSPGVGAAVRGDLLQP